MTWCWALVILTPEPLTTNLMTRWTIAVAATLSARMSGAIANTLTLSVTHELLMAWNLLLEATAMAGFDENDSAGGVARPRVATLLAPVLRAGQHFLAR